MGEWLADIIANAGYIGIAFLMFAETVFPPIPSEVIMPLAGLYAAQQELSLVGVILAGTAGALLGNIFWYLLARALGLTRFERWTMRYGRWLTIEPEEVHKAQAWFDRHGAATVAFGRLVPTIRSVISIPAGILRMRLLRFVFYSSIGTFVWTTALAVAGYLLGSEYTKVDAWFMPLSNGVIALLLIIYLYRVITYGRRRKKQAN